MVAEADERRMTLSDRSVSRQTTTTNEECVMSEFRLLINGRLVAGASTLEVINPAPRADQAQRDQAVAAAKATPLPARDKASSAEATCG
jgi:hypothetical protein